MWISGDVVHVIKAKRIWHPKIKDCLFGYMPYPHSRM